MDLQSLHHTTLEFWLTRTKSGQKVEFCMLDGNKIEGILREINPDQSLINVSELNTPMGQYPEAQLRMSDIKYIKFIE